ncbi:zinc ABC transporter substrate-binding protein [Aquisalimonas sp.]|uniref:metal ABC transporter solute-binding protein, Zn/Mn family n=1 Tax=unclassified Aquisalimonas TaxID=2644645 RepID=UPI0025BC0769|nr:zinc ABC transporter substrate-binding protein [Aquisalimonas sp.]
MRLSMLFLLLFVSAPLSADKVQVVASFTVIADMTREVAGEHATVTSLVGPDGDSHAFEPAPEHARRIARADLVVRNGLGFEGWMDRLLEAAGGSAHVVTASRGVDAIEAGDHAHDHHHGEGHGHGHADPHAWLDVRRASTYVRNIRDGLKAVDPDHAQIYAERAEAYLQELQALDSHIRDTITAIPGERRRILTSHAAFGYFEDAYGVTFLSPRGLSTEAEPSAADVAELVRAVRAQRVAALLPDNLTDARLLHRIAEEGDMAVGPTLYSDALSPGDGPAPTYLRMMGYNAEVIAEALAANDRD